jgi:hypothetical protein
MWWNQRQEKGARDGKRGPRASVTTEGLPLLITAGRDCGHHGNGG